MATDVAVSVADQPGGLADVGEALGNAGINIEGLCGVGLGDRGVIHILVEYGAAARAALEGAVLNVESEAEAIVSAIPGDVRTPGTLGKMARSRSTACETAGSSTAMSRSSMISAQSTSLSSVSSARPHEPNSTSAVPSGSGTSLTLSRRSASRVCVRARASSRAWNRSGERPSRIRSR